MRQITVEEKEAQEIPLTAEAGVCMVYKSACEQCCRLYNNSMPFKVHNEKF